MKTPRRHFLKAAVFSTVAFGFPTLGFSKLWGQKPPADAAAGKFVPLLPWERELPLREAARAANIQRLLTAAAPTAGTGWHGSSALHVSNTAIHMLADIVSKNGNLLLNIPVRGDGTIDEKELAIVEGIAGWMDVNKESIFGTRPWKTFGEGPASAGAALSAQGFNEGKGKPTAAADFRFTAKGKVIYAIELGWPTNAVAIKSFGKSAALLDKPISKIQLLGSREKIKWSQSDDVLTIEAPKNKPSDIAIVFKITTK